MNGSSVAMVAVDQGDEAGGHCELLGSFALFVQGALGALALLVLIWKRSREHPQRPLLVWFMDVSKQVIGAVFVHIANLLLSMLSSGSFSTEPTPASIAAVAHIRSFKRHEEGGDDDGYHSNPCSFYLLNLGIDTTLGVVILIYLLRLFHRLVEICPIPGLKTGITSGYYGDPPRWKYWTKQSIIYFTGLMTMKFMVWIIFAVFPWLGRVGDWLLAWTEGNRQLQIFFVMFFFPLIMNAFQYYVIDSFIKHQDPTHMVIHDAEVTDNEPGHQRHSFGYGEDDDSGSESGGRLLSPPRREQGRGRKSFSNQNVEEYNPDYDGANSSVQSENGSGSPQSGYFKSARGADLKVNGNGRRAATISSQKSRNSSMMLLPGSRGPSTPGYADEDHSQRGSSRVVFGDDDSTLVDGDRER